MQALGVEPTPAIGEALYVGLVTDTGRFMYENTGPRAHEMAAQLLERRASTRTRIYRRLYEGIPQGKLELLARGLSHVERYDGGLLDASPTSRSRTTAPTGADESYSEGVVDHLRSVEGTAVAGLDPRPARAARRPRARSPCAPPTTASTSRGSPARWAAAATGAPPASRPTSDFPELVEVLRAELARQL